MLSSDSRQSADSMSSQIEIMQSESQSARAQIAASRLELTASLTSLHKLYREVLESSIRVLEQTIHGSMSRGIKAKADYLATVADGMSKKLQLQHSQLLQQAYSADMQTWVKERAEELEEETRVVRRKIREHEETLEKYGAHKGAMRVMARESLEIKREIEKVMADLQRLEA